MKNWFAKPQHFPPSHQALVWNVASKSWKCAGRALVLAGRVVIGTSSDRGPWQRSVLASCPVTASGSRFSGSWMGSIGRFRISSITEGVGTLRRQLACQRDPLASSKVTGPSCRLTWRGSDRKELNLFLRCGLRALTQSCTLIFVGLTRCLQSYLALMLHWCWWTRARIEVLTGSWWDGRSLLSGNSSSLPSMRQAGDTPVVACWIAR